MAECFSLVTSWRSEFTVDRTERLILKNLRSTAMRIWTWLRYFEYLQLFLCTPEILLVCRTMDYTEYNVYNVVTQYVNI